MSELYLNLDKDVMTFISSKIPSKKESISTFYSIVKIISSNNPK